MERREGETEVGEEASVDSSSSGNNGNGGGVKDTNSSGDSADRIKDNTVTGIKDNLNAGVSTTGTNSIFTKTGATKTKKASAFLQMDASRPSNATLAPQNSDTQPKAESYDFQAKGRLAYLEDSEWIEVGQGTAFLKDHCFYFIRDFLNVGILKLPTDQTEFKKTAEGATFTAKTRRSLGDTFEVVDREYKLDFLDDSKDDVLQFFQKLQGQ